MYWRPVYKYVRMKWHINSEDAADFTQEFFAHLLEKEFLNSYDSHKGRLRTFLRTCADRLFMNQMRDSQRLKRGGGAAHFSLDLEEAERELATVPGLNPQRSASTRSGSAASLLSAYSGCGQLRIRGQDDPLRTVRALRSQEPSGNRPTVNGHEVRARATDVTNYFAFVRREFRRCVLDQLREMTASDEEYRREARILLGVESSREATLGSDRREVAD